MIMADQYFRLCKGVNDKGILLTSKALEEYWFEPEKDYYSSVYFYNETHKKQFDVTHSVAGIKDTLTDKLVFDFDDKANPENARHDAIELLNRLQKEGVKKKHTEIFFSGNKGYHVVVHIDKSITPEQAKNVVLNHFGKGLNTLDTVIYNPARIFRIPGTKHDKSGLYKIPISLETLSNSTTEDIKLLAKENRQESTNDRKLEKFILSDKLFTSPIVINKGMGSGEHSFDISKRPKGWKLNRWAIAQGYFEQGERNEAMMILSATCKAMGDDLLGTYYRCKSALEKHMKRTNREDKFDKIELWKLCERTFDGRDIGQYSDDHPLIKKICERLSIPIRDKSKITSIDNAFEEFKVYAQNIDKLTVKTGILELDEKLKMTIGMSVGIVGTPGSGKTSVALQMVNNMSKAGHFTIVFSYDMYKSLVIQKLVQNHMGVGQKEMFEKFKNNDAEFEKQAKAIVSTEYKNVAFCFESGQTIEDILQTIEDAKLKFGQDPKLIVVDYNELVITDVADPTQSSALVAQKMRQIANDYNLCAVSLFQPAKIGAEGPAKEITSYYAAKGSGAVAQSTSVMLGISRPGFDPRNPDNDQFMTINCLKNRMGAIFSLDLHWNGQKGIVKTLTPSERMLLNQLRTDKEAENDSSWE